MYCRCDIWVTQLACHSQRQSESESESEWWSDSEYQLYEIFHWCTIIYELYISLYHICIIDMMYRELKMTRNRAFAWTARNLPLRKKFWQFFSLNDLPFHLSSASAMNNRTAGSMKINCRSIYQEFYHQYRCLFSVPRNILHLMSQQ